MNQKNFNEYIAMILLCFAAFIFGFSYGDGLKSFSEVTAVANTKVVEVKSIDVFAVVPTKYTYTGEYKMNAKMDMIVEAERDHKEAFTPGMYNYEEDFDEVYYSTVRGPCEYNNTT